MEVSIIRPEHETQWSLEVVNAANTSIVWDDLFARTTKPSPKSSGLSLRRGSERSSTKAT